MPLFSRRLLILPLTLALAHCGGGGAATTELEAPPPVAVDPYAGTAYLKVQITTLATGGGPGLARSVMETMVDQCNSFRKSIYDLAPVRPDQTLMAGLDIQVVERFYDNRKAAEARTAYGLRLTDYERWNNENANKTAPVAWPATAPDCAATQKVEANRQTTYVWRDGIRYELRHDSKQALGRRNHISFTEVELGTASEVAAWPKRTVMGQSCSVASLPARPTLDGACLWDRFPAKTYLNLPWVLESKGGAIQEVSITTLALEHDKPLPAGVFDIPPGFTEKVE